MPHPSEHPRGARTEHVASAPPSSTARRPRTLAAAATALAVVTAMLSALPAAALDPTGDGGYRFDFGEPSSPVAEGWTQVVPATVYSVDSGYGLVDTAPATLITRNRSCTTSTAMPCDFVAGPALAFAADVPASFYDVTVTIGDAAGGSSAAFVSLEGGDSARVTSPSRGNGSQTFRVEVVDGRLDVGFQGDSTAYVNGIEIVPAPPVTPEGLTLAGVAYDAVDLSWTIDPDVAHYSVLRADIAGGETGEFAVLAPEVTGESYSDPTVVPGAEYAYAVTATDAYGRVSAQSATVTTGLIPELTAPDAPGDLVAEAIAADRVDLMWSAATNAVDYLVERVDPASGAAVEVATVEAPGATDPGVDATRAWLYRVTARNEVGAASAEVESSVYVEPADYRFDFQRAGDPVMDGYTVVTPDTAYSAAAGFGFETPLSSGSGRDRGSLGDALIRDFVLPSASGTTFLLDVPRGTYAVKTYSGDLIASSRTSFSIEGRDASPGNANSGVVAAVDQGRFAVSDGQLDIVVSGSSARLNGLEVDAVLLAPVGLAVSDVDADPDAPSVALAWTDASDVTWNVYRQSEFEPEPERVATVDAPAFEDASVRAGMGYEYYVTAVDADGLESVRSEAVSASLVDDDVAVPGAPADLEVERIEKNEIEISWAPPVAASYFLVYRSTVAGEQGELVGIADTRRYTDDDVLTTIPYYYTVVALNSGGAGPASEQLATTAVTILQRQAEYLDRAPLAVQTDDGVLVTWRLLGTDPASVSFDVSRDGEKITDEPITDSTNLLDPDGSPDATYVVTTVLNGVAAAETDAFAVQQQQYLSLPLQKPADGVTPDGNAYTYSANDTSVGDVDGDGQYEYIVKWYPSNAKDNSQAGYTGNVYLDAYRLDGTRLWRVDLGVNIRAGAHYTHFMVYDFDGNGTAEMIVRTADGTVDGTGQAIGDPAADHRNSSGYILSGPEYLTVFDGLTGRAIDTVDYTPPRGQVGAWGDTYGNRVDRFLASVAYLDGEHPSAIFSRGYYTRAVMAAYDFDGQHLNRRWVIDSNDEGSEGFYGQGDHSMSVADVDGDSKDEIVYGSATVDDDGTLLYSTGLGHGDAQHVSDLDPSHPGLEVFSAHEEMKAAGNRGATMRDAATGEILWDIPATVDTGRAATGDIDPRYPGAEAWAIGGDASWNSPVGQLKTAAGETISENIPAANFLAWFDGDPLREIVDHDFDESIGAGTGTVAKWDWTTEQSEVILRADGALSNNSTKGTPNLQADLFGDWREEIAWRAADSSELRIYSTTDVTDLRIPTLMHDMQYRVAVAWQNTGYNQPPWPSFFIGDGMDAAPLPKIAVTGFPSTSGDQTPPVVSGLPADGTLVADSSSLTVDVTAEDPESGLRSVDIAFDGVAVGNGDVISFEGLSGRHTLSVRAVGGDGTVTAVSASLLVFADEGATKTPARGTLSSDSGWDDGLRDGSYTVAMNLWYGVNGSVFRLYEDGALIATQLLDPHSPDAQITTVEVEGKPNGTYVYTGELVNAVGATATTTLTVKVTDAAPGVPVLSNDNQDKDGDYTVSADMWWGTNGTRYALYENGVLIDEHALAAHTPEAQHASTAIAGRAPGTYVYVAEFSNAAGATSSKEMKVTVK